MYIYVFIYFLVGPVDGYVKIGDKVRIFEFLGCMFHGCNCGAEADEAKRSKKRAEWEVKKAKLQTQGELFSIWECDWTHYKDVNLEVERTPTKFPLIMKKKQTEIGLLNAIKEGSFYGFVRCDLW